MIWFHRPRAEIVAIHVAVETSSHGASAFTAAMKASVTRTDKLKLRRRRGSRLAAMKASMSGWSQRMVPIIAPRLRPPT